MRKEKLEELKKYMEELKTIKKVEVKDGTINFLNIKKAVYFLNNGKTINREELVKNNTMGDAISILPITEEGNIILVVQPRPLTKNTVTVELPAGYVDKGETPVHAAGRELREETGYVSNSIIKVSSHYQDQGCSRSIVHSFIALNAQDTGKQELDESEYIRHFICTYEEALELMEMSYIMDANSIITLEKSRKYIKR
jgi:ADP-ribose pyrophosphatase